jgi:endonuclease YncB( thermonuclease family)
MKGDNTIIPFGRRRSMPRAKSGSSWRRGRPFVNWPWGARSYLTLIALAGVLMVANLLGYGREFPAFADMFRNSGGGAQIAATGIIESLAKVIDGDTLHIAGQRVRLHGIDAPESAQQCKDAKGAEYRCGQEATAALAKRIGQQPISCKGTDIDRYGRIIAVCRQGAEDINAWMVSQGWAMAYRTYSLDYVSEEGQARAARRGVWRGEFTPPWDWRTSQRDEPDRQVTSPRSDSQGPATAGGCRIKGNISSKGERIYHVPGGRWYDPTKIDAGAGERWFCTEAEARAAGWRPSKQ